MAKKSFVIYENWAILLQGLPDKEAGELIKAICSFQLGKEPAIESQTVQAMYSMIRPKMEEDVASYEETVKKRAEAGKSGAKKRWNDDSKTWQSMANDSKCYTDDSKTWQSMADNDNDTDTVNNNNNNICGADAPSAVVDKSDSTHDVEDESDKVPYKEIIDYLNQKLGTHYLPKSKDSRKAIHARWAEGYRLEDFKTVIDNMIERWGKDAKMADYLRPITLFSPKFESYLNLKPVAEAKPANQFHNFEQRDEIDFDDLEAQLDSQLARDLGGMP